MKKFIYLVLFGFAGSLLFFSCDNDLTAPALLDSAPVISITANGSSPGGDTDVTVTFNDGDEGRTLSPLASASITITDPDGAVFASVNPSVSGTSATATVTEPIPDDTSAVGTYTVSVTATDVEGNSSSTEATFDVISSAFAFVQPQMFILGSFNGWGGTDNQMELVADNTWEDTDVTLSTGDEFKFANTSDFSDLDWTDQECDGTVIEASGIQENIACVPFNGTYTIRFNDAALTYELIPDEDIATEFSNLFLLGTFNDFEGDNIQFTITSANTWEVEAVISTEDKFRFSTTPTLADMHYGDNEPDGVADEFGSNIQLGLDAGTYRVKITVNDLSLEYTIEVLEVLEETFNANQDQMFILGSLNGWGGSDLQMELVDDNLWQVTGVNILASDPDNGDNPSAFKFVNTPDFSDTDWGDGPSDGPAEDECDGLATADPGGKNIQCADVEGSYTITFNDETLEYTITLEEPSFNANQDEMYILGSLNGWGGTDLQMQLVDDNLWQVTGVNILASDPENGDNPSAFKFVNTPDFSDTDWGDGPSDGPVEDECDGLATADPGGKNIQCADAEGSYIVTFNDETLEYSITLE